MDQAPISRKQEVVTILAVLIVIAAIATTVVATGKPKIAPAAAIATNASAQTTSPAAAAPSSTTAPEPTLAATTTVTNASSTYRDGSYTTTVSYNSPGGVDSITVTIGLQSDVISSTAVQSGSTSRDSEEYVSQFIANYKSQVVGKPITSVKLNRVAGASLTSQGFNAALLQIEKQARA